MISENMIKWSPRFIHFDEYQLYYYYKKIKSNDGKDFSISNIVDHARREGLNYVEKYFKIIGPDGRVVLADYSNNNKSHDVELCVGIANMKVSDDDIEKSHTPSKKPNLSIRRQSELYSLLNAAIENKKCDILVMPELSVPVAWVSFISSFVRKNQIGVIFGLEHCVVGDWAYNVVVTMLPFVMENEHNGCVISMRLKNHYAPHEVHELKRLHLEPVHSEPYYYERFIWRGSYFTVFNCYEMSDLHHRGLMKSLLDVMFAISWNKDVFYYSNIIESIARDLHCYVAYSNTSQFGDSRIIKPSSHEEMDMVYVKGGFNTTLLKEKIMINSLRDFQIKEYYSEDKRFKPVTSNSVCKPARDCSQLFFQ